jgi:hypothetical protein
MCENGIKKPVETIPRMGGGGDKGECRRGEFKYDMLDIL